jgi:opacity protein-like surface antigen
MKNILILITSALLALPALSADTNNTAKATAGAITKDYKSLFNAGEIQIEAAGHAKTEDLKNFDKSVTVGGNYYVTAGAGLHAAVCLRDLNEQFIDRVEFGLIGRVPVESLRTALLFGVGAEWQRVNAVTATSGQSPSDEHTVSRTGNEREDDWAVYAEVGPLFRLSKYLDVFAKVRGVRPVDSAEGEHIDLIIGTSVSF